MAAPILITLIVSYASIVFGELVPKRLALADAEKMAGAVAGPLTAFSTIASPLVRLTAASSDVVARAMGIKSAADRQDVSEEEIRYIVADNDELDDEEKRMIHEVLDLGDTTAEEAMTPRVDMVVIEAADTVLHAIELMRKTGYSRLPVFSGDHDNVVGMVRYKDLIGPLLEDRENDPVSSCLAPISYVPESKDLMPLLNEMQTNRQKMVMVVDEYGGTAGLITIEDIVEEIVGDIIDETDLENRHIIQTAPNEWLADGAFTCDDAADLGWPVEVSDAYETIAGWLMDTFDRVESIEVHAGRSADLDASNRGGYVDIILRSLYGVSGFLRGSLGYNGLSYDAPRRALLTESVGAGITYGRERWSVFANVSLDAGRDAGVKYRRETSFLQSGEERTGNGMSYGDRYRDLNANMGLTFRPTERHTFSIEASLARTFPATSHAEGAQLIRRGSLREQYTRTTATDRSGLAGSVMGNYRYASKDNRHKVDWLANYIHDRKDEEARWDVRYTLPDTLRRRETNTDRSRSEMFYTQLAYTHRLSKEIELMAGGKYARTAMRNDNGYAEDGQPTAENRFRYVEQIPAAFAQGSYSHGPLYLSAGLRMEQTDLRSHDGDVRQTYTGLYPSVRASYTFAGGLSANLSYSRTLFRPPFQLLNHHVIKLSEREYYVGNPLLKAEVNDNIRLRLSAGAHTLYLRWGYSPNPITNTFYSSGDTLYGTNLNAARKYEYAASYSFSGSLWPWWHLAAEVELQHMYLPESQYKQRITQAFVSMRHTWTIARAVSVDLNANYSSPWIMNDKWIADHFKADLSARYTFAKSGLTLSLTGRNLLARRRRETILRNAMLHNREWAESAPLSIMAGLTWRFSAGRKKVSEERIRDNNMDKYRL